MFSKAFAHLRQQWSGVLALFLVLTGGVAYAAGTIGSADVINNSLRSVDLKDGAAVNGLDVVDGSLTGADIHSPSLSGDQVLDDSLTGFQIDESTLDLPGVQERAKRIDYAQPDTDATMRQIGYQNGLYLYAKCFTDPSDGTTHMRMFVSSDFDASISSLYWIRSTGSDANGNLGNNYNGEPVGRSEFLRLHAADPAQGMMQPDEGELSFYPGLAGAWNVLAASTYRSADAVITVNMEMIPNTVTHSCKAYGTMLSATGGPG